MSCSTDHTDAVLQSWREQQDQLIAPGMPVGALAVPQAIIAELGLPESCFEAVAAIFEIEMRAAVHRAVERAGELG